MLNEYDIAYGAGALLLCPYWLISTKWREKVREALANRMGRIDAQANQSKSVLIHAVSLGEMNATVALVKKLLEAEANLELIVSATTIAGFNRGRELYSSNQRVRVVRFPLDFKSAMARFLDALNPSAVVLMELELWPNFLRQCRQRKIPVALVNGRMTPTAFNRYRLVKPIMAAMLRRLSTLCVQDDAAAQRFIQLGALPQQVRVTGTMKFDTAQITDRVAGDDLLATAMGLVGADSKPPIWVCGSTGPGEEKILLRVYQSMLGKFPALRLVLVPRKTERFDEIARLIRESGFDLLRRSTGKTTGGNPVILGDTMGELRKFYSLADLIFVGRTLVDLGSRQHGSDMMEPAALAKPVVVGPYTGNFAEVMRRFRQANAIVEISDETELQKIIIDWLTSPEKAREISQRAQAVVRENQGATDRHAEVVVEMLNKSEAVKSDYVIT